MIHITSSSKLLDIAGHLRGISASVQISEVLSQRISLTQVDCADADRA